MVRDLQKNDPPRRESIHGNSPTQCETATVLERMSTKYCRPNSMLFSMKHRLNLCPSGLPPALQTFGEAHAKHSACTAVKEIHTTTSRNGAPVRATVASLTYTARTLCAAWLLSSSPESRESPLARTKSSMQTSFACVPLPGTRRWCRSLAVAVMFFRA